jgi:hypothetical protein
MEEKRSYRRRSDEERIADLERKLLTMKDRLEQRQRRDSPVLREAHRLQRKLRKFAQLAEDNGRTDLANTTVAFVAGLEAMMTPQQAHPRRRGGKERAVEQDSH